MHLSAFQSRVRDLIHIFALSFLLGGTTHAAMIQNGSFNDPGNTLGNYTVGVDRQIPGWTISFGANDAGKVAGGRIYNCLVTGNTSGTGGACGINNDLVKDFSKDPNGAQRLFVYPGPSPDGGNYFLADADPDYNNSISTTVTGLVAGKDYVIRFYQSAGQFQTTSAPGGTKEQWQVTFGGVSKLSNLQTIPDQSLPGTRSIGWSLQQLTFRATGTAETLSFLAVGSPNGLPPVALLDGVSVSEAPEPATLGVVGAALAALILFQARGARSQTADRSNSSMIPK